MAKPAAFVLPSGINLDVSKGVFTLKHDGDVVLEQTFGLPIGSIETAGNLTLQLEKATGKLSAKGEVTIAGDVDAESVDAGKAHFKSADTRIHTLTGGQITVDGGLTATQINVDSLTINGGTATAKAIQCTSITSKANVEAQSISGTDIQLKGKHNAIPSIEGTGTVEISGDITADRIVGSVVKLTGGNIQVKAISATKSIELGPGKVKIDILIAPKIKISDTASGRATVVESSEESNTGKLKGGFSLAEYDDLFGDSENFLADRGVSPLGTPTPARGDGSDPLRVETSEAAPPEEEEPEVVVVEVEATDAEVAEAVAVVVEVELDDEPTPVMVDIEEEASDITPAADEDDTFYPKLNEAILRITACYEGEETPGAVSTLHNLIQDRDYEGLRENITEVWNGLLGFHQRKGIRPHHQVTHAFNVIHGLIQESA